MLLLYLKVVLPLFQKVYFDKFSISNIKLPERLAKIELVSSMKTSTMTILAVTLEGFIHIMDFI